MSDLTRILKLFSKKIGLPPGGSPGQVLTKSEYDIARWMDPEAGVPGGPHTHEQEDVIGLVDTISAINSSLGNKAASSHTHTSSEVTDFQTAVSANSDVAAMKAIIGQGVSDGDSLVDTLSEMLATFQTYSEGVDIATQLAGKAPALGADDNYVTDTEKVKLSNLSGTNSGDNATNTQYSGLAASKQNTLVSGTNIKTINGSSVLGAGDLVIGGGSDPFTAKLRLAGDVATGANVTPVNLTGMSFTYEANSTYKIEWYMAVTAAAATTGHGFGLNCTTAPVLAAGSGTSQLANTGTVTGWQFIANNAIAGVTSAVPTAGAITPSLGQGILVTHATNGGTCQFIFRSETTAATICKAGSVITVMKISPAV